jgi:hypothetical protein
MSVMLAENVSLTRLKDDAERYLIPVAMLQRGFDGPFRDPQPGVDLRVVADVLRLVGGADGSAAAS